eukprot:Mrub_15305.p2 GENE.Mrub_15305~~Mrub_15305.p2  ORF type:complete len:120 (+),score=31.81 Mrub_15305:11-370(+)
MSNIYNKVLNYIDLFADCTGKSKNKSPESDNYEDFLNSLEIEDLISEMKPSKKSLADEKGLAYIKEFKIKNKKIKALDKRNKSFSFGNAGKKLNTSELESLEEEIEYESLINRKGTNTI